MVQVTQMSARFGRTTFKTCLHAQQTSTQITQIGVYSCAETDGPGRMAQILSVPFLLFSWFIWGFSLLTQLPVSWIGLLSHSCLQCVFTQMKEPGQVC